MDTEQNLDKSEKALRIGAVSGSFYIGQKVRTIHDAYAEIAGIYDGKYPYVVRKFRNGKTYLSDYSANQLVAL